MTQVSIPHWGIFEITRADLLLSQLRENVENLHAMGKEGNPKTTALKIIDELIVLTTTPGVSGSSEHTNQ